MGQPPPLVNFALLCRKCVDFSLNIFRDFVYVMLIKIKIMLNEIAIKIDMVCVFRSISCDWLLYNMIISPL
jgi:hypothetical protein